MNTVWVFDGARIDVGVACVAGAAWRRAAASAAAGMDTAVVFELMVLSRCA
jgi:hypothetical protein